MIYLLQIVSKWISLLVVSLLSLFHVDTNLQEQSYHVGNENNLKNVSVVNTIIPYETTKTYNDSLPNNLTKKLVEGQNGLMFTDFMGIDQVLKPSVSEEVEVGTGAYGEFTGVSTGYGPDCKTCSGRGTVACKTREGTWYNLINDGIYYEDIEFGKIRILSAAREKFPCGTVIYVDNGVLEPFIGVVLDTGSAMVNAWKNSKVHIDIAYETEKDESVRFATNMAGTVKYSVQRWGW